MAESRDYAAIALQYARDVVDGTRAACRWVILACERQLRDLSRQETPGFPFRYEPMKGTRVCRMLELLPHIKGRWQSKTIRLEPWQIFILMTVFSWVWSTAAAAEPDLRAKDGLRRFRIAYTEVPRKNAKSTITAGVGLYMLAPDNEEGAECYSTATTKDQARIVFDVARGMAKRTPEYCERFGVEIGAHALLVPESESVFKALSADDNSLDGLSPHFAAIDELHAHKTRGVYDVLETATGSRSQSLLWAITTAGSNRAGICYEVRSYITKVLDGTARGIEAETYFGVIYTIDDAHTGSFQSLHALRQLDNLCSCEHVPTTLIAQSWRAACAPHATTASVDARRLLAALHTPTGQFAPEDSAAPATTDRCGNGIPITGNGRPTTGGSGRSETAIARETPIVDGEHAGDPERSSIAADSLSTASLARNTTASSKHSQGAAASALSSEATYAWITTTAQALFGDSSANDATRRSVFSETLKQVFSAHSPTCAAREARLTEDGELVAAVPADDWTDPRVWAKANPNYGVSVFPDDIARACRKAQEMPSAQPNFLTKRLNVWVNADSPWMDMRRWDKLADTSLSIDSFAGEECFIGIDLASNVDIAATMYLFRRSVEETNKAGEVEQKLHYYAFGRFYLPEDVVEESDNSQYKGWERSGRLITTDGNIIDQNAIQDDIRLAKDQYQIREVAYDPFQATKFATELGTEGFPMVEMGATVKNFSSPMKEIEALVRAGRLHHTGDPVLAWMMSNVVCHVDKKDNVYPNKQTSKNKIDGAVALIMAVGRAMHAPAPEISIYETRGITKV